MQIKEIYKHINVVFPHKTLQDATTNTAWYFKNQRGDLLTHGEREGQPS